MTTILLPVALAANQQSESRLGTADTDSQSLCPDCELASGSCRIPCFDACSLVKRTQGAIAVRGEKVWTPGLRLHLSRSKRLKSLPFLG